MTVTAAILEFMFLNVGISPSASFIMGVQVLADMIYKS